MKPATCCQVLRRLAKSFSADGQYNAHADKTSLVQLLADAKLALREAGKRRKEISRADDMELLLDALRAGAVEFYQPTGELRSGGLMYSTSGDDWSRLLDMIGREQLVSRTIAKGGSS